MHGGVDRVTDPGASARFARTAGPNCTFRSFAGLFHELHNEPERAEVLDAIVAWLEGRLGAG